MDPTKRCCTCHELRPLSEYNLRKTAKDGLQARCRSCSRAWYAANREGHRANTRRRTVAVRREYKRRLGAHLSEHPCVDCGESDVRVLEFDHRPGVEKHADVASMVASGGRWSDIEAEIAKCDVRCASCHRRLTCERRGDWRAKLAAESRAASAERAAQRLFTVLGADR
jgi:hypothetical protein